MNVSTSSHTLHLYVVKDAYAWFASMQKHPHHNEYLLNLPTNVFLLSRWQSTLYLKAGPYIEDVANIFQLRASKLISWLKVSKCLPFQSIIQYEDFNNNPEQVIRQIANRFGGNGGLTLINPKVIETDACVMQRSRCQNDDNSEEKKNII